MTGFDFHETILNISASIHGVSLQLISDVFYDAMVTVLASNLNEFVTRHNLVFTYKKYLIRCFPFFEYNVDARIVGDIVNAVYQRLVVGRCDERNQSGTVTVD